MLHGDRIKIKYGISKKIINSNGNNLFEITAFNKNYLRPKINIIFEKNSNKVKIAEHQPKLSNLTRMSPENILDRSFLSIIKM